MHRIASAAIALCVTHVALAASTNYDPSERAWAPDTFGGYASTHVVIRVAPGVTPAQHDGLLTLTGSSRAAASESEQLATLLASYNVSAIERAAHPANERLAAQFRLDRYYIVRVPAGSDTPALADALSQFSSIEIAELDGIGGILQTFPNDADFGLQYGLHNTGQTISGSPGVADADLDGPEAWSIHTGTDNITIAIIDTGVSQSHPDFAGKLLPGRNFNGGSLDAWDDSLFISHGTHCAGIAAAAGNNGIGVAGVSWGARILPVKVLNDFGGGEETWCANGVIWAADQGAHVGSMSLGYPVGIQFFEDAINYAWASGMVLVAATGNTPGDPISPPARWENVIAVGATNNRDQLASFTTTGPEMDLAAPGVAVWSCVDSFLMGGFDTYAFSDGTSMACPHVAGAAALLWSYDPAMANVHVRDLLELSADDLGAPGWDHQFGHGRVNAFAALSLVTPPGCPADIFSDGVVDAADLNVLLSRWDCPNPDNNCEGGDLTGDGNVDAADLNVLLSAWGPCD